MTAEAIVACLIAIGVLLTLASTRIATDAVLLGAVALLLLIPVPDAAGDWRIGVLSAERAVGGFGNTGLITVAVLFVIVCGMRETGSIDRLAAPLLGHPRGLRRTIARIFLPVCGLSAFLNNTPVVAMLIPAVSDFARRLGTQPSRLMIPLSYAAILGGTCTLIGTSTNLIVAGLVSEDPAMQPMGFFGIAVVGVPCAIVGGLYLILLGPKLLPERGTLANPLSDPREFTAEMIVPPGSPLDGQTIEEASLRHLPESYIVEIERSGERIVAVGPEHRLRGGDRLVFVGAVESIRELQNFRGLAPASDQIFKLDAPRYRRCLFEAVVSEACPIVGRTIREGRFRSLYDAAVIAVARHGSRVRGKIGDIQLRQGDTLLIEAHPDFERRQRGGRDFLLVRALEDSTPRKHSRMPFAIAIVLAMVTAAGLGVVSMLQAALAAGVLMILTRCCSISAARRSVDWSLLIAIGAAIGVGRSLEDSGAASVIAGRLIAAAGDNPILVLAAIYIVTSVMTELITNNAAAVMAFPFAHAAALHLGIDMTPFAIAIMIAASASFATPLGYQTNLMVYGPGGYRFSDYLRIGIPMNILVGVTSIALIPNIWSLHPVVP